MTFISAMPVALSLDPGREQLSDVGLYGTEFSRLGAEDQGNWAPAGIQVAAGVPRRASVSAGRGSNALWSP